MIYVTYEVCCDGCGQTLSREHYSLVPGMLVRQPLLSHDPVCPRCKGRRGTQPNISKPLAPRGGVEGFQSQTNAGPTPAASAKILGDPRVVCASAIVPPIVG